MGEKIDRGIVFRSVSWRLINSTASREYKYVIDRGRVQHCEAVLVKRGVVVL